MKSPTSHHFFKSLVDRPVKGPRVVFRPVAIQPAILFRHGGEDSRPYLLGVGTSRRVGSVRFHCPELKFPVAWNSDTECLALMYRRQVRLYGIRERLLEVLGMRTLAHSSPALTWVNDQLLSTVPPVVISIL